jgi:16S rRNA (cytosine1402-N4)-methyltransferase
MTKYHTSVLLKESVELLNIKPEGTYIDGTMGEAGHSQEILKKLSKEGNLISIDRDQSAIDYVKETFESKENWEIVKGNFTEITQKGIDGILLDLGMSSRHLEEDGRGFSIHSEEEELDMRMDKELGVKASDLLKVLTTTELEKLFRTYGEEHGAKRIAEAIKKDGDVSTVGELTGVIKKVVPATYNSSVRRVFQALRIAVNDELNSLSEVLEKSFELLNNKGRIVVITFHSLEDRIVKKFFKEKVGLSLAKDIAGVVEPTQQEIEENPRSHSAKLRAIEKL